MSNVSDIRRPCWQFTQSRAAAVIDRRLATQLRDTASVLQELHRLTQKLMECSPPPGDGWAQVSLPDINNSSSPSL